MKIIGKLYIGYTTDLKARFKKHNAGEVFSTKPYLPWKLIFYEAYPKSSDAKRREMYLKTVKGRTTLKTMLRDYFEDK
jgi:putative endonuclease